MNAARKPLAKFDGPTTPPGTPPKGKSLAVIIPVPVPLPDDAAAGVKNAAAAVGWKVRVINGQGTPQGFVNAIQQAISSKVDGIVLAAMPVPLLQPQIKAANKAGIPVVAILPSLASDNAPAKQYGLFDYASLPHEETGKLLADWVIQNSPKGAKVIRYTSAEFPDLNTESAAFAKQLEAAGPNFKIAETVKSPVTDTEGGQQGVQRMAAAMRSQPDAKYIYYLSESWAPVFLQAKKLVGRNDITGLGSDGDVTVPLVKQGQKLVMIGPDSLTYGWYAVDALIRAFNHKPPLHTNGGYDPRVQLVDTTNAASVNGKGITATYDYQSAWKKLWGIGG